MSQHPVLREAKPSKRNRNLPLMISEPKALQSQTIGARGSPLKEQ